MIALLLYFILPLLCKATAIRSQCISIPLFLNAETGGGMIHHFTWFEDENPDDSVREFILRNELSSLYYEPIMNRLRGKVESQLQDSLIMSEIEFSFSFVVKEFNLSFLFELDLLDNLGRILHFLSETWTDIEPIRLALASLDDHFHSSNLSTNVLNYSFQDCDVLKVIRLSKSKWEATQFQNFVAESIDYQEIRFLRFPAISQPVFVLNEFSQLRTELFWNDVENSDWESVTLRVFRNVIRGTTTVIDFGAWIGPTVLYAAALGARLVVALEPDLVAHKYLLANLNLNPNLEGRIISLYNCISAQPDLLAVKAGPGGWGDSMSEMISSSSGSSDWKENLLISCNSMSTLLHDFNLTHADLFIKVDVEGFERTFLPSWISWVENLKPVVFVSMHRHLKTFTSLEVFGVVSFLSRFPFLIQISKCSSEDDCISYNQIIDVTNLCIDCDYLGSFYELSLSN